MIDFTPYLYSNVSFIQNYRGQSVGLSSPAKLAARWLSPRDDVQKEVVKVIDRTFQGLRKDIEQRRIATKGGFARSDFASLYTFRKGLRKIRKAHENVSYIILRRGVDTTLGKVGPGLTISAVQGFRSDNGLKEHKDYVALTKSQDVPLSNKEQSDIGDKVIALADSFEYESDAQKAFLQDMAAFQHNTSLAKLETLSKRIKQYLEGYGIKQGLENEARNLLRRSEKREQDPQLFIEVMRLSCALDQLPGPRSQLLISQKLSVNLKDLIKTVSEELKRKIEQGSELVASLQDELKKTEDNTLELITDYQPSRQYLCAKGAVLNYSYYSSFGDNEQRASCRRCNRC
ncbi:MAG: hypothetical protein K940chlam7_01900 [Chlamydiae bacterium]|nr:hypothetical protein [Chlamydiota bacterium]